MSTNETKIDFFGVIIKDYDIKLVACSECGKKLTAYVWPDDSGLIEVEPHSCEEK